MRVINHFSLENFRLFKEKTSFDLAPITILTGTNSSGKSSLIKAILLLKSNFEKNKSIEEIDFSIGEHNLNNFKNSLNYDGSSDTIAFFFSTSINFMDDHIVKLEYQLDKLNDSKGTLNSFSIHSHVGELILSASKEFDDEIGPNITYKIDLDYFINNMDRQMINLTIQKKGFDILNEEWIQNYQLKENTGLYFSLFSSEGKDAYEEILLYLRVFGIRIQSGWTSDEKNYYNQSIVDGLGEFGAEFVKWIELNLKIDNASLFRTDFAQFFFRDFSKWILIDSIRNIIKNFDPISHFSSVRSITKRYYDESDGDLLKLYLDYKLKEGNFNPEVTQFIKDQLKLFSLGEYVHIDSFKNIVAEISVVKDGRKVLIADLGFGVTQLLPIILKIALVAHALSENAETKSFEFQNSESLIYKSLFLLEEPESNLHPAFQSKIAEMIAYAAGKFKIRFVVETHSEYLIRNLQYLIAKKTLIISEAVKIYYFNKPGSEEAEETLFRTIQIESNGRMTRGFGSGFFDEAESIAFELFMLNQNRQN